MRHIRDPITGYCIICEKNNIKHFVAPNELDDSVSSTHGSTDRSSRPRQNDPPGKKTIYVNAYPNRSPSPSKKRPSSSLSSTSSSSSDSNSANSARKSTALSARSTSKLVLVDRRSPSPSPRNRSPSPVKGRQKSPDVERGGRRCCGRRCCQKTGRGTRGYDDVGRYEDRCCGYRNFETASFGAGTWGIRRWCAPLMVLLALGAIAGLAVGIYYGVKAVQTKNHVKQQVIKYIKSGTATYVIVGLDQPCNRFNNYTRPVGTATTPLPNCNAITTKIYVGTPKFIPPTDPDWLLAYTQASGAGRLSIVLSLTSLGDASMLAWVVGGVVWMLLASFGSSLYG